MKESSRRFSDYEVTQAQWEAVMSANPGKFKGAVLPVEQVSWNDARYDIIGFRLVRTAR